MEQTRVFRVDGDEVTVLFRLHRKSGKYLGKYPDFSAQPRRTPSGRPWVNVINDDCPYAPQPDNDCGRCGYLQKEHSSDLIGVCFHEARRQVPEAVCGNA